MAEGGRRSGRDARRKWTAALSACTAERYAQSRTGAELLSEGREEAMEWARKRERPRMHVAPRRTVAVRPASGGPCRLPSTVSAVDG
jgi:hypothetical protein